MRITERDNASSLGGDQLVVAIDGGGTKTECLVARSDGTITGYGKGGPVNLGFVDASVAEQSVIDAVEQAIGSNHSQIVVVCLGATVAEEFVRPLLDQRISYDTFHNVGEAAACLASGTVADFGAVVLAGTGAFEWARNRVGVAHRTDGWGAFIGDQGSAFDMVRRALVAAARAVDGRGPKTVLVEQFCNHFEVETLREVGRRIYRGRMERHEIAALAPLVSSASHDDDVARTIVCETGQLLSEGLNTCIRAVQLENQALDVVLCGGVFSAGQLVITPIAETLASIAPEARLIRPEWPPVVGVLAHGLTAIGHSMNQETLESIGKQYLQAKLSRGKWQLS